ncbi:hypothetical protein GCM10009540_93850 [Streptomyces turgidiscabies]
MPPPWRSDPFPTYVIRHTTTTVCALTLVAESGPAGLFAQAVKAAAACWYPGRRPFVYAPLESLTPEAALSGFPPPE